MNLLHIYLAGFIIHFIGYLFYSWKYIDFGQTVIPYFVRSILWPFVWLLNLLLFLKGD